MRPQKKRGGTRVTLPRGMSGQSDRRSRLLTALALGLAAFAVRAGVLWQLGGHVLLQPSGVLDDAVYVQLAARVARGDLAIGPDAYFLAPLYTYFLGLIFALSGGPSVVVARAIQVLLGTASVLLISQTASLWFGRRAGLIAGATATVTGVFAFNEILILQSALDPFLTSLALYVLSKALQDGRIRWFAVAGGALGLLSLNRPNAVVCVIAVSLAWLAAQRSRFAFWQSTAIVLGAALVIAPVTLRNRVVAGDWALITSHGGLNFYIGNGEGAHGAWRDLPSISPSIIGQAEDTRRVAQEALGRPVSASEASDYFYGLAARWIRSHPIQWIRLLARKVALTLNSVDITLNFNYAYYAYDEFGLLSFLFVGPWLILPLGMAGFFIAAPDGRRKEYLAWAAWAVAYAASVAAFFVSSRYRLPLLVPLVVTAAAMVDRLAGLARARAWRATVPLVLVLGGLFAFANWPVGHDQGRIYEREEHIVRLVAAGRLPEADRLLDAAATEHPNFAALLMTVGSVLVERHEPQRAIPYLERSAALNPRDPAVRAMLGRTLVDVGRSGDAIPHLAAARAAGFDPAGVTLALVSAYRAQNEPDGARKALSSLMMPESGVDAETVSGLALACLELADGQTAERFLRTALKRSPYSAVLHEQLGVALGLQRRDREAEAELETAVRLAPENPTGHYHLALEYAQQRRFAEARDQAEQALKLQPDYDEPRLLLTRLPR